MTTLSYRETWPQGYKTCVHSQTQIKAQGLAACEHVTVLKF